MSWRTAVLASWQHEQMLGSAGATGAPGPSGSVKGNSSASSPGGNSACAAQPGDYEWADREQDQRIHHTRPGSVLLSVHRRQQAQAHAEPEHRHEPPVHERAKCSGYFLRWWRPLATPSCSTPLLIFAARVLDMP